MTVFKPTQAAKENKYLIVLSEALSQMELKLTSIIPKKPTT
jgi:hypothetical protein